MSRPFHFKKFSIFQEHTAMKVGTDGVLLGCFVRETDPVKALDIGAGTGLLSLMLAQKFNELRIDAVEIDEAAYTEASRNVKGSLWATRIQLFHESLQELVQRTDVKYDLIICNPPYFRAANESKGNNLQKPSLSRSRARFADHLPFDVLVEGAGKLLKEEGCFYLVLPSQLFPEVECHMHRNGLFLHRLMQISGKEGTEPNRLLMKWGREKVDVEISQLSMHHADSSPTEQYIEFTKDFYLWKKYDEQKDLKW